MHASATGTVQMRYRTTAPGAKTQAFNFVPFGMAVAAAICMEEDPVLRLMKTTPSRGGFCGAAGEHSFLGIPCHCCHDGVALQHSLHPDLAHQQRLLPAPTRRVSQNAVRCCAATLTSPVVCCILPLMTPVTYDANLAVIATADVLRNKPRLLREKLLSSTHCCLAQGSAVAAEMLRGQSKPSFPPPPATRPAIHLTLAIPSWHT